MRIRIIFSFLTLALCCAFSQNAQSQDATAKNKVNVIAAYDALNHRDWTAFAALCTPEFVEKNVGPAPAVGLNAAIDLYKQFESAFPDFMVKINEIVPASSTRFLLRVTITGTNTGSFMGLPPTGKPIKFDDADVIELNAEGKAISHSITNMGEPLRQIGYGSLSNPNTGVVMAAYQAFGKGDVAGVLALCTDNIVFEIHDRILDTKAQWYKGKAEVGQYFQKVGSNFQYTKFQPTRFVADGDDVFALIDAEYTHIPTGKKYATTYTHHFKVENGKIAFARGLDDFQTTK